MNFFANITMEGEIATPPTMMWTKMQTTTHNKHKSRKEREWEKNGRTCLKGLTFYWIQKPLPTKHMLHFFITLNPNLTSQTLN